MARLLFVFCFDFIISLSRIFMLDLFWKLFGGFHLCKPRAHEHTRAAACSQSLTLPPSHSPSLALFSHPWWKGKKWEPYHHHHHYHILSFPKSLTDFSGRLQIQNDLAGEEEYEAIFCQAWESIKRSSTVSLVTDEHRPRTVKSQLITCHMNIALHWAIFTSAEIAMSFHPRLARS